MYVVIEVVNVFGICLKLSWLYCLLKHWIAELFDEQSPNDPVSSGIEYYVLVKSVHIVILLYCIC